MTEASVSLPPGGPEMPAFPKLSRLFRLQFESAQDAWVLLYPEGMVQLNQSAAEILRRCDGRRHFDDIVIELQTLFGVSGLRPQIEALVQEGQRRGWID